MVRYEVIYDYLNIRTGPSTAYKNVGEYEYGDVINSGGEPFRGEDGKTWVRYSGGSTGRALYVCYRDGSTQYLRRI